MKAADGKYVGTTEYANFYGISRETVRANAADGKFPGAEKIGGSWRIPRPAAMRPGAEPAAPFLFPDQRIIEPEKSVQWFDDRWYKVKLESGALDFYPSVTTILAIINNKWLARWRGDVGNAVADRRMHEAADKGSRIHHACAFYVQGGAVLLDNRYHSMYEPDELRTIADEHDGKLMILYDQDEQLQVWRFTQWMGAVKPEVLGVEMTVFSHEHQIAGTLDYLVTIKTGAYPVNGSKDIFIPGGTYILDLKTGRIQDADKHPMQVAAYVKCADEPSIYNPIADLKIDGSLIVYTNAPIRGNYDDEDHVSGLKTVLQDRATTEREFADFKHARALWWRDNQNSVPRIFDLPKILSPIPKTEETV